MMNTSNTTLEQTTRSRASWPAVPVARNASLDEMLVRIGQLALMDLEVPVAREAWDRANRLAWEIGDFIRSHPALPRPDVFATGGEISFEWQAHRTGRVRAIAVLDRQGVRIDLTIVRDGGTAPSFEAERKPEDGIRTFLLALCEQAARG
jgi:hypothetical protein